ncbi:MAG: signal peptidase [Rariglobus sp.]|jgi:signal peptidase I|nr:signal peptidase [Rariglobus sp.]
MKPARALARLLLALTGLALAGEMLAAGGNPVSGVSVVTALKDANELAASRTDLRVLRVEGASMLPYFGPGAVIVVKTLAPEKLRAGMVVVYTNRFNETIAHRLIGSTAAGWTASGYNNSAADSTPVTAENLVGVVYATFHSDALPATPMMLASVNASGTPVALAAPAR